MVSSAQMVVTRWGDVEAVSLASPQLPGIVAAFDEAPSPSVIMDLAIDAGLDPSGDVEVHVETALTIDEVTYFVRMREDFRGDKRAEIGEQVVAYLHRDEGLRRYVDADQFGDAILICSLPSDSLRRALATALPHQPVTLATVDERGMGITCFGIVLGAGPGEGEAAGKGSYLVDFGLNIDSTVGEILKARTDSNELLHV